MQPDAHIDATSPSRFISLVISPEMTVLIGRGPFEGIVLPAEAIAVAYGLGAIEVAPSVHVYGANAVHGLLAEDAAATRILLLVAPTALARIEGVSQPEADAHHGYHLPPELRAIALALRDCDRFGEAGEIYRAAKAIELLWETWRRLDAQILTPLSTNGSMSHTDAVRILAVRELIDARWNEKLSLGSIAAQCGLNRDKLTRGFREMFACTVAEAIVERRLIEASRMLETTDLPVSSIGYENGYLNNASFARAFGRRFGQTPSDYRAARLAA
ncbi:MAG: AraC family transcriptional regulator [Caulobacteraceae bacterium]|nr:AraC family transcriptional regulator [Caulobacteraceae bacterium]